MKATISVVKPVLFSVIALVSVMNGVLQGFLGPQTIILPRSQSVNAARDLVGWQEELHRYGQDSNYWAIAFTPEYTHTFNSCHLTQQLFGQDHFFVSGSDVPTRNPGDLLADYFELPRDYQGGLCVYPRISQFIADFNIYVGLDGVRKGLFFIVHFPVVNSKWDIRFRETTEASGTDFHPAGYFSDTQIPRKNLLTNVREYFATNRTIGDVKEPLLYQKIIGLTGRNVTNKLSEIQFALGYDIWRGLQYHAGIEARASAPTGTRPNGLLLFDAVVGNGHHWELGFGLTGHYCIAEGERDTVAIYLDANITHLFKARSTRSFNLCGRCPGSRFMMLEDIAQGSNDLFVYGEPATHQYTQQLLPVINVTTFCVDTSFAIQGDVALKIAWYRENFCLDLGYNFWGRSHEKLAGCSPSFEQNRYVLKGDAQIYGFDSPYGVLDLLQATSAYETSVPLSVTQHQATIFAGQGNGNFVSGVQFANDNADNPLEASGPSGVLLQLNTADAAALGIIQQPVMTSQPSLFIANSDLDLQSGLVPTSITNKFFMHGGYTWFSLCCDPFLGLGGEIEWAHGLCNSGAIAQWGIWVKTGIAF